MQLSACCRLRLPLPQLVSLLNDIRAVFDRRTLLGYDTP